MNSSCTLFNGDAAKCETLIVLKRLTGSLSILGCVFMIFTIWLFHKYNIMSQRLILYLSIAALFDAIAYMVGDMTPDGGPCDFEAWMLTYFDWTVLMWVSCITFNLYQNVIKNKQTERLEKVYHFVSWVVPPFLLSVLPFAGDNYGPAGAWCWIKHDSVAWRFAIWYVPLFIAIAGLFFVYIYIIVRLRRRMSSWQGNYNPNTEMNNSVVEEDIKVLKAYPFIYLALSIFPLTLRIHNAVTAEGTDIYALWILTVLTAPLQGAVNAIAFGIDPDTRKKLNWNHVQLAWASRSNKATIREYPTLPASATADDALGYEGNVMQRQVSQDQQSYNSLN